MNKVWLEFQNPNLQKPWLGGVLLVGALMLSAAQVNAFIGLQDEVEHAQQKLHRLERNASQTASLNGETQATLDDTTALRLSNFGLKHWETLFNAFENAADETITLLSLQPDGSSITLTGEAKNTSAASSYLKRLHTNASFIKAYLNDFEIAEDHPQRPVHFAIVIPGPEVKE